MRGFEILELPILVTEQYPKGLGHTVEILRAASQSAKYFEKSHFSSCVDADFVSSLRKDKITNVVVAGVETHVCVNQSVHDLIDEGFVVHLLEDATASRNQIDHDVAVKKMYGSGAVPATHEMVLFELLHDSQNPHFKQIQGLIK